MPRPRLDSGERSVEGPGDFRARYRGWKPMPSEVLAILWKPHPARTLLTARSGLTTRLLLAGVAPFRDGRVAGCDLMPSSRTQFRSAGPFV